MNLFIRFKKIMCAGALLVLAGNLPAYALTSEEFNAAVKEKGCNQAVDQAYDEKMPLQDLARRALDPNNADAKSCILEGTVVKALAEGMSLEDIIAMFQGIEGLNPTIFLAAMSRAGVEGDALRNAARKMGISDPIIVQALDTAEKDLTQAYTPDAGGAPAAPLTVGNPPVTGGGPSGVYASPSTL